MTHRNAALLLGLVCSVTSLPLLAGEPASGAASLGTYSEERNAATTYVGTLNFYIGRMAASCTPLLNEPDTYSKQVVSKWQSLGSNGRFYQAAVAYQGSLLAAVEKTSGTEAMHAVLNQIQSAVHTEGQGSVDDQLKGTTAQNLEVCKLFATNVDNGALNITAESTHFFKTLDELATMLVR